MTQHPFGCWRVVLVVTHTRGDKVLRQTWYPVVSGCRDVGEACDKASRTWAIAATNRSTILLHDTDTETRAIAVDAQWMHGASEHGGSDG
jgi:hypothetical protein